MRRITIAALLGITLSSWAYAADPNERSPVGAQALLGGVVQERDVSLVFDYLRDAFRAAIEGREAPPPDELKQRAEAIGEEVKRRGLEVGKAVIDAIEDTVREGLGEPRRSAPVRPSQRI